MEPYRTPDNAFKVAADEALRAHAAMLALNEAAWREGQEEAHRAISEFAEAIRPALVRLDYDDWPTPLKKEKAAFRFRLHRCEAYLMDIGWVDNAWRQSFNETPLAERPPGTMAEHLIALMKCANFGAYLARVQGAQPPPPPEPVSAGCVLPPEPPRRRRLSNKTILHLAIWSANVAIWLGWVLS